MFEPYVDAVYSGMWEQALDMGDTEIFLGVLDRAGLPRQAFVDHIGDPEVKQALIDTTNEAVARGVFGSPMFFVGEEMFFGKDRLREVEEEFVRSRNS